MTDDVTDMPRKGAIFGRSCCMAERPSSLLSFLFFNKTAFLFYFLLVLVCLWCVRKEMSSTAK